MNLLAVASKVALTTKLLVAGAVVVGVLGTGALVLHHAERAGEAEERAAQLTAELRAQGVAHEETQAACERVDALCPDLPVLVACGEPAQVSWV